MTDGEHETNSTVDGQVLRTVCSVAWILVQEQDDLPAPVMTVNDCRESSEVLTSLPLTCQEQPMPGVDVDRAEDDSPGIEPRAWHQSATQKNFKESIGPFFSDPRFPHSSVAQCLL